MMLSHDLLSFGIVTEDLLAVWLFLVDNKVNRCVTRSLWCERAILLFQPHDMACYCLIADEQHNLFAVSWDVFMQDHERILLFSERLGSRATVFAGSARNFSTICRKCEQVFENTVKGSCSNCLRVVKQSRHLSQTSSGSSLWGVLSGKISWIDMWLLYRSLWRCRD